MKKMILVLVMGLLMAPTLYAKNAKHHKLFVGESKEFKVVGKDKKERKISVSCEKKAESGELFINTLCYCESEKSYATADHFLIEISPNGQKKVIAEFTREEFDGYGPTPESVCNARLKDLISQGKCVFLKD